MPARLKSPPKSSASRSTPRKSSPGQKDLDATWDEYVAHIEAMNLQRCIEVYQAACDRFNAR